MTLGRVGWFPGDTVAAMIHRARFLIVVAIAATAFGVLAPSLRSSCAGPSVSVRRPVVSTGATLVVLGRDWGAGCDDVQECSSGCLGTTCDELEPSRPVQNLWIELVPRSEGVPVVVAEDIDVDQELRFRVEIRVPADLEPGRYTVVARNAAGHVSYGDPLVEVRERDGG